MSSLAKAFFVRLFLSLVFAILTILLAFYK
jgi:hypothetical protein